MSHHSILSVWIWYGNSFKPFFAFSIEVHNLQWRWKGRIHSVVYRGLNMVTTSAVCPVAGFSEFVLKVEAL